MACASAWPAVPPAPADSVLDDTRALPEAARARVVDQARRFHQELNCRLWIHAGTFLDDGETLRQNARALRQAWSGQEDAVLLAYDRSTDAQSLSFSPGLWERYPSASLILLMQEGGTIMGDKQAPLEERLERSVRLTADRLRVLDQEHRRMNQGLSGPHWQIATLWTAGLGGGAVILLFLGSAVRRRETNAALHLHFPDVEVATRFGAPFGGGVAVEKQ